MEESTLNKIFEGIEEELYSITPEDKEKLANIKHSNGYDGIIDIVDNFNIEAKKILLDRIEEYVEDINCENAYFNEKFYKSGFKDGANLIIECKK